jgi:hypothetical protein
MEQKQATWQRHLIGFAFANQGAIERMVEFRIDDHTIKRGNLYLQWSSRVTKCEVYLHMHCA